MSQMMKNVSSNLALYLVFGLLAGMLINNPSLGVLGGLLCHLFISNFYYRDKVEKEEK